MNRKATMHEREPVERPVDPAQRDPRGASEAFVAEVLRINERYTREVVEAFAICPFARGARVAGHTCREVLLVAEPAELAPALELVAQLEARPAAVEVVQVIFPRLRHLAPREFEHFNARLREAHAAALPPGRQPVFAHATFHPGYPFNPRTPDSLVAFFRRAPDPTIQLVRLATIDALRGDRPAGGTALFALERLLRGEVPEMPELSASERIGRDNHARLVRDGPAALEAVYRAISADRDASYARVAAAVGASPGGAPEV